MKNKFELIMFDLDGTIAETGIEIALAVNDSLRQSGFATVSQQQVNGWIGHGTLELMVKALAFVMNTSLDTARTHSELGQLKLHFDLSYQRHCGTVSTLYPQVRESLTVLKARGVKLAVVTNKDRHYTDIILNQHQLVEMVDMVIGGDEVPAKKPDPAGLKRCLDFFNIAPERALFVGDSAIDAATARNANMAVWLLPYGYNQHQDVRECAPDRVITSFAALIEN